MNKNGSYTNRKGGRQGSKKYYQIIEDDNTVSASSVLSGQDQKNYEALSKSMLKNHHFLYIDMNDSKGFKLMKQCEESDTDEETEQLGNNFIKNLDYSSDSNSKAISYMFLRKKENKKKSEALNLMYNQLRRSRQKMKKYAFFGPNKNNLTSQVQNDAIHVYRGMDSAMIDKIKQREENEEIYRLLKQREDKLLEHYNTVDTHRNQQKVSKEKYEASIKNTLRINTFLPILNCHGSKNN